MTESKIYTRKGDGGETSLFTGGRVRKTHARIQAYGTIDELNSALGVARSFCENEKIAKIIFQIQNKVMSIASILATKETPEIEDRIYPKITETDVINLEKQIDFFNTELPPLTTFIVPGEDRAGALLDLARTTCRRAERAVVLLGETEEVNPLLQKFLNRLSDLLFVLERAIYHEAKQTEKYWTK